MNTLSTSITIDAPPQVVWSVLMDFESYSEWNTFIPSIAGEASVGSRIDVTLAAPGQKPVSIRPTVMEVDKDRRFSWRGKLGVRGLFDGNHRFTLEPRAGDSTEFVHEEDFTGLLVPIVLRMVGDATRSGFETMNQALKDRTENL